MRWVPRSLFSRLVLVLAAGLLAAQLVSLAIHTQERGELLLRAGGVQSAQRIADIVRLLEPSDAVGRRRIARVLSEPPLVVSLELPPLPTAQEAGPRAVLFSAVLGSALGKEWPIAAVAVQMPDVLERHPGGPPYPGMHRRMQPGMAFVAQVRLHDGTLATFDARQPVQAPGWPYRVLSSLAVLVVAVLVLSLVAVRWTTRPLQALADAAEELGRNIERAPMPESGPLEVARAAKAFNTMQGRLLAYVRERTNMLAAMSHDLKTPVTRLRLRAELLEDPELRRRFTQDLEELESMVAASLDYLRSGQATEATQPIDVAALLASVQADLQEMGQRVEVAGVPAQPLPGQPVALKRCVRNLVENAVKYGGAASVEVQDTPRELRILVRDEGPGLPPAELERVFEPFHRGEASRNRETGGTGLGLTIARNIAQAHGGEITLRNRPGGGLEARLALPRAQDSPLRD